MNLVKSGGGGKLLLKLLYWELSIANAWALCKKYDYLPVKFHPLIQCLFECIEKIIKIIVMYTCSCMYSIR